MKKRTTRCLALLLAVVMVLSVMPVAMAEETAKTATLVTDASNLNVGLAHRRVAEHRALIPHIDEFLRFFIIGNAGDTD